MRWVDALKRANEREAALTGDGEPLDDSLNGPGNDRNKKVSQCHKVSCYGEVCKRWRFVEKAPAAKVRVRSALPS